MESTFMFTRPLDYELKGDNDLVVFGDISTTDPDLVNDIVSKACLESMKKQIEKGNIKLDLEHEAFRGDSRESAELAKTIVPAGKLSEPTITERKSGDETHFGLNVKGVINPHKDNYKQIKGNIVDRYLDAFSIAFIPTKSKIIRKGDEEYRQLDDVRLLNVALTGNPINTAAQMREVVAKSIDAVEQYKEEKKADPTIESKLEVKGETENEKRKVRNEADNEAEEKKKKKTQTKSNEEETMSEEETAVQNEAESVEEVSNEESSESEESNESEAESNEEASESSESDGEESEPLSEVKSMISALHSDIKSLSKRLDAVESDEVKAPSIKANSKSVISNEGELKSSNPVAGLSELR